MTLPLQDGEEVSLARLAGVPIVALESTIITHGFPWPDNLDLARRVEAEVRSHGACPATIAVLDGRIRVGLGESELEMLARAKDVLKLSRADLAPALISGRTGSTTVAATMIAAHAAGIAVFATGGIGGVHRGAETTFDMSADLQELARTPVITVAAGAKAILDIPKTLEVLETLGVPVITFGADEFPAFWSRSSGLSSPLRADRVETIAAIHRLRQRLTPGGMLVANPIPAAAEIPAPELARHIETALAAAASQHVSAKAVTPFLLDHIFRSTEGSSLRANVALVLSNAGLASQIAVALGHSRA